MTAPRISREISMSDKPQLNHPWLVAAWPGMGNMALNAAIHLLAKKDMRSTRS